MAENAAATQPVAIVTGAGHGIGRGCAMALAESGVHVIVTDINVVTAQETHDGIAAAGGASAVYHLDVTDEAEWASVVNDVARQYGPVTTLVNNAALKASLVADDRGPLDLSLDTFDRMLAINLRGPLLGARAVLPTLLERKRGSIVNISSVGSLLAAPYLATAYRCSKAGVNALTRAIAVTYGPKGIRCNAVAPGVIMVDETAVAQQEFEDSTTETTGRAGRPQDIGAVVAFLASDAAAYVNGQILCVDGGLTARLPGFASATLTSAFSR
jgi:NAD(P)-dependent dehydrogenase (short-subunit alcohol dehydrogenase family)